MKRPYDRKLILEDGSEYYGYAFNVLEEVTIGISNIDD